MVGISMFTGYNLVVGVVTGVGLLYFLSLKPTAVEYHRFPLLTVSGLLVFLVGGPITELLAPSLVHWVHGIASLLVVFGLYSPLTNDLRRKAWADILLRDPERVRQSNDWMLPVDDAILQLFHATELVLTPSIIAYNIEYSRDEVNRRLTELEERGFVTRVERGKYRITELGKQYIEGSIREGASDRRRYLWKN